MPPQQYGRPSTYGGDYGAPRTKATRGGGPDRRRTKQGKAGKGRGPLWAKLVAALGALVMVTGVGGAVTANYYLAQLTSGIETTNGALSNDTGAGKAGTDGKVPKGAIDLLLLGLDTRAGWDKQGMASRSDTIIILHVSASHDQAYMISIPRDTVAEIPPDQTLGFNGTTDKINGAYAFGSSSGHGWQGGARLAAEAVNKLTGISFDGVMVIDFAGFSKIVEVMGGVYLCIDHDTWSSHYVVGPDHKPVYKSWDGSYRHDSWIHKAGCRDMAGWEALDYARQRDGLPNTDYDRQRHQQQLLRAMAKKATSAGILTDPAKLAALVHAAGNSLKVDTNQVPIADFIFGLKAIAAADVVALKTNSGTYASVKINGQSGERITPATQLLFEATKNDTLGAFVIDNPEYLIPDSTGTGGL